MGIRRTSRECAVQMLYQIELSHCSVEEAQQAYWSRETQPEAIRHFADELVRGVRNEVTDIDQWVATRSTHWKIGRMPAVDRNILRLAVYELKHCPDIPLKVALNEAIEIAKKFGSEESGAFINGVLDKIAKELRPNGAPAAAGEKT